MNFTQDSAMLSDGSIMNYIRDYSNVSSENISLEQYLNYFINAFQVYPYCNFMKVGIYTLRVAYIGFLDDTCLFHKSCPGIFFDVNSQPFKLVCIDNTTECFIEFDCIDTLLNILNSQ